MPELTLEDLWAESGFTPNPEQEQAIRHIDGPLYLTAGPGSGKTRVLLWRTLNLIVFHGVKPEHIFLSTFTEKAAHQLREGLKNYLGQVTNHTGQPYDLANMYVGTLHSLSQKIIQDRNLNPNFRNGRPLRVMDELETYFFVSRRRNWQQLIEAAELTDLEPEVQNHTINTFFDANRPSRSRHNAVQNVLGFFGRLSEEMIDPQVVMDQAPSAEVQMLLRMYARYRGLLAEQAGFDYTDFSLLQQKAYDVVVSNAASQQYFRHIIIDEYQDTNLIQERLVFKLAAGSQNLCVVGDDDQALYRFRGATVENFVEFPARCQHYLQRQPVKIPLSTNYRSRNRVVQFYTDYITRHSWQKEGRPGEFYRVHDKNIQPYSQDTEPSVITTPAGHPDDVSAQIAALVRELLDAGKVDDPNQIAFLFPALRNSPQVNRMRNALEAVGLQVYAPRAGRFLDTDEPTLIFGAFLHVFGKPQQGPFTSQDYTEYFAWLDRSAASVTALFRQEPQLKRYLDAKRQEVAQVVADYRALLATCEANGWDVTAEYAPDQMKEALYRTRGLSLKAQKAINSVALTNQVRRRLQRNDGDKEPFKLGDIINRSTALDWTILDLFYRLGGFPTYKRMYDLAESGQDEGPICNLGLISQYLSRFMEMYAIVISASFLNDDRFQRLLFMSFLYSIYRRSESEFENAEDPFPKGRIPFLTIHQAKGLEFPVVVVPNLRKDARPAGPVEETIRALVPSDGEPLDRMARFDVARMFYVALSRAKSLMILGRYQATGNYINAEFRPMLAQLPTTATYDVNAFQPNPHREEKPPKAYSYTADYLLYERCPRQYMVFRRYGLVPSRSQTQFFGSLVHYTIEDLHHHLIQKRAQATLAV
ncbi:UvrD-helicase domain-containing protein [Hymenobacter psychrotolerans]|uniref:DNA 3'-5' helicase n=1 Tax=Hymenobacter psychrotolerans DSM 18569 TaxID=1121959 RepID=A0A1M6UPC0_9BACT|nr:ATP-dependent helicase [Hymenobacter psychrotolerans]SHK71055.1 DNA helicase-2 / ATP-dependent DNA helicase PcrA [Hymenobacter psychrotolerans DSM 18569]